MNNKLLYSSPDELIKAQAGIIRELSAELLWERKQYLKLSKSVRKVDASHFALDALTKRFTKIADQENKNLVLVCEFIEEDKARYLKYCKDQDKKPHSYRLAKYENYLKVIRASLNANYNLGIWHVLKIKKLTQEKEGINNLEKLSKYKRSPGARKRQKLIDEKFSEAFKIIEQLKMDLSKKTQPNES